VRYAAWRSSFAGQQNDAMCQQAVIAGSRFLRAHKSGRDNCTAGVKLTTKARERAEIILAAGYQSVIE
jgi:hypothetical protein